MRRTRLVFALVLIFSLIISGAVFWPPWGNYKPGRSALLLVASAASPEQQKQDTPAPAEQAKDDEWTLFRGNPLQSGVAVGALPDKLVELWKFATKDKIEGAPAIKNGVVYVGSLDEHLYALDLANGRPKWNYKGGPFKSSPSLHDGRIYLGDSDGIFHCVDCGRKAEMDVYYPSRDHLLGELFRRPDLVRLA